MRIVVAFGGNALQRRGEPMTVEGQRNNVAVACASLAPVAQEHELVITHGNGPQVGLLALRASAYNEASAYPFDVLDAQTEGMIGYLIEQELGNRLPPDKPLATVLTMTQVDRDDPAFVTPTKFVGPVYSADAAQRLADRKGWSFRQDGMAWRRVVPSPLPRRIVEIRPIEWLLQQGCVVVCAGGGGIPTTYPAGSRALVGVEAVIDKNRPAPSSPPNSTPTGLSSPPTSMRCTRTGERPSNAASPPRVRTTSTRPCSPPVPFIYAITLTSTDRSRTVPAAIAFFTGSSQFETPIGSITAAAVVITVPVVLPVVVFQRRTIAGLTSGAVKGWEIGVEEIVLDHITKRYPDGTEAVADANLTIADGELIVLVGPSGCGKSTTLNMIAGLDDISEGTLTFDGQVVNDSTPRQRDVAMVFQS